MKKIFSVLTLSLVLVSCNKTNIITITGTSPIAGEAYGKDVNIKFEGTIEATEKKIVQYTITLKNMSAGTEIFSESTDASDKSVSYNESWTNDVTSHSDMMLIISAKDKRELIQNDTTHFHCHPM